jgi:uncharacterized membrane protein YdjX (TVP38/TMEM64 family)
MKPVAKNLVLLCAILGIAIAFLLGDPKSWLAAAIDTAEKLGPWGPVIFILAYVIATVLMVPGSALTLAAGTLFGVGYGTGIVSIASTMGAAAAFLVGRFLARDAITAKTAGNASFVALDRAMSKEGWKIVALARLSPVFPFTLLNYAFGLTRVKFLHYVLASWIAMLPGTLLYVYLGSLARAGVMGGEKSPAQWAMYAIGLLATLGVTIYLTKMAKKAIAETGLVPAASKTDVKP